jgi:hypothetical protein
MSWRFWDDLVVAASVSRGILAYLFPSTFGPSTILLLLGYSSFKQFKKKVKQEDVDRGDLGARKGESTER